VKKTALALLGLLLPALAWGQMTSGLGIPGFWEFRAVPVSGADSFRVKAWNSWPQANQVITTNPSCESAGPENAQAKVVIKFRRRSSPWSEVTATKIITMDNDRGAAGASSAGVMSVPFGAAAGRGRTVTDGNATMNTKSITGISIANPTQVTTSGSHGLSTGDLVYISGTNSTPVIDGLWHVINASGSTFNVAVNVTGSGSSGTLTTSKTLTSNTASFTANDVGKNITLTGAQGSLCASDGTWGSGQPWTGTATVCEGPKFPYGSPYQGAIIAYGSSTSVTVKPSMTANPGGTATLVIEPVLLADQDGAELGDGWVTGVDINYWSMGSSTCTLKRGQWFFEAEINRGRWNMHEGITLIKNYVEPSGHLSWPNGYIASGKVDGRGWTQSYVLANPSAGADWTLTVPSKTHWKLSSIRAILTDSSDSHTRTPNLIIDDGSNTIWVATGAVAPATSNTTVILAMPGIATANGAYPSAVLYQYLPLPPIDLTAGWRVRSSTTNIQSGDQWSSLVFGIEEWIEE